MQNTSILLLLAIAITATSSTAILRFTLKNIFTAKSNPLLLLYDSIRLITNPDFLTGLLAFVLADILWLLVHKTIDLLSSSNRNGIAIELFYFRTDIS
jgi:hypothetical protein